MDIYEQKAPEPKYRNSPGLHYPKSVLHPVRLARRRRLLLVTLLVGWVVLLLWLLPLV